MSGAGTITVSRPSIFVAGKEEVGLSQGLIHLSIRETVQGFYRCEARFGNWGPKNGVVGFLYFDRKKLDFGTQVQIKIENDTIMDGRISAIEADFPEGSPPGIVVLFEDRLQDLRMTRRTRTFADVTDSDVITRIANDHGLQTDIDVNGPSYKVLAQVNQSDLAFVRDRVRSIDGEVWVEGRKLLAKSRAKRAGETLKLNYGADLRQLRVIADTAMQRTSLTVNGWDVAGKAALQFEARDTVIQGELNGDNSGPSILKASFGDRKESVSHMLPLTSDEAQAQAESTFKILARRFVTGVGIAQPNAKIHVGSFVDLQQLGPLFSGKYYVSEVHQVFDSGGFRTEFSVERPGIGQAN